jgi:predicted nucleotidyltransferase component of viral defense system
MNNLAIQEWLRLTTRTKQNIFSEVSAAIGLPDAAVEKDWWIMRTLEIIFSTEIASFTVFKGGTSLSKAWGLIERFSEDIDLALDRKFLNFGDELSISQVRRLREKSFDYLSKSLFPQLQTAFSAAELGVELRLSEVKSKDQDPLIIEIYYPSVTEALTYIQPRILVEIGSRSLREPYTPKKFRSMVGEHYDGQTFADSALTIPTVNPERTFLEKIFLLHEEFQKSEDKIRVERLSRHLYDIEKIMDTEYAKIGMVDKSLYEAIVHHRRTITALRGINYENHVPELINPIPPSSLIDEWKKDYETMQASMIYGSSLVFKKLIERIVLLKEEINKNPYR